MSTIAAAVEAPEVVASVADDWKCIEDFCGSWSGFGFRTQIDVTAWWSPSRKLVKFSGGWGATPRMPAETEPTEEQVWAWATSADTHWGRRYRAAARREAERAAHSKRVDEHFRKFGYNWVSLKFVRPDGSCREISQCVGIYEKLAVMRIATGLMTRDEPRGTRLADFKFETGLSADEVERRRKKLSRAWCPPISVK